MHTNTNSSDTFSGTTPRRGCKHMATKKKDTIILPRGIRPHRSGYIVDVTVGGKRRIKTAATLEAALLARETLRCGELWRLECRDIDLERGTLTAWKTKNHHPRTVPIVGRIRPIIERRMRACGGTGRLLPMGSNDWLRRPWNILRYHMGMDDDPQFVPHMLRQHAPPACHRRGGPCPSSKSGWAHEHNDHSALRTLLSL